jgi:hypothetical protein
MLAIGLSAFAAAAYAAPAGTTDLTPVQTSTRDLSTLPVQTANAQGGNVTELNIAALTITKSWQGYYGNISGIVALQDGKNNTFYNWTMANFKGRVFASRSNTVQWSTVNCTNATNETDEMTYLNQAPTDSDSVLNTFNKTTNPGFLVGSRAILPNTCFSTNGYVSNNSQSVDFPMLLLSDLPGNTIYTTVTNQSTIGFDGQQHDFELLVGANSKVGGPGVTQYYFWTEFD